MSPPTQRLPLIRISPSPSPPSLESPTHDMSPTPLCCSSVSTTLQYITPPSQLDQPLPPFLLSKSLLQRHHFLSISPEDPVEYLCWPSDSSTKAIDLLERQATLLDDSEPPKFTVQYSSDGEYTYAHVALSDSPRDDGVRLVFQWDMLDGWKFHDVKIMPFPAGSSASLLELLASIAKPGLPAEPTPAFNPYGFEHSDDSGSSDDDDYWNAYGAGDSGSPSPPSLRPACSSKSAGGDSEDAYWAQYSSVHGTADSTIPSPRDPKRRPVNPFVRTDHTGLASDSPHPLPVPLAESEVLAIPPATGYAQFGYNLTLPGANKFGPASPSLLARLLEDLPPRPLATDYDNEYEFEVERLRLQDFGADNGMELSPLDEDSGETFSSPENVNADALGIDQDVAIPEPSLFTLDRPDVAPTLGVTAGCAKADASDAGVADDDELALQQSVQGLFALWRLARARKGLCADKAEFMNAVGQAVGI